MKNLFLLAVLIIAQSFYAQVKIGNKPQYTIIINNEISTREKLEEYGATGYIKSMNKGVSQKERDELANKFGDKIGDKEFIMTIGIYTEEEKKEIDKKNSTQVLPIVSENIVKPEQYILKVNDVAKDFTLKLVDGKEVKLSDLKGKVVLINFWATWCAPCLMEFYDIPSKIIEPNKENDFVFLAISIGESQEKVLTKVEKLRKDGIDFNFGIDPNEKIWNEYGMNSIPKNFLIDKDGVVKFVATGNAPGNLDNIAAEIKKLLSK